MIVTEKWKRDNFEYEFFCRTRSESEQEENDIFETSAWFKNT